MVFELYMACGEDMIPSPGAASMCQHGENHWPPASDAMLAHIKELMTRLVVDHPSKRQNSDTSQVRLLQCAHMPPSGPQSGALNINLSFSTKTGGLKMEYF